MPESAKIQFTPAQSAAITARGGSLLVSAAAGSGKTRVLVERVVGLITDPIHPVEADSLLIMTFTNAAAAKLRADITTRLAEEVRAHPGDMRLRRQHAHGKHHHPRLLCQQVQPFVCAETPANKQKV